jgi:hypothetical protein
VSQDVEYTLTASSVALACWAESRFWQVAPSKAAGNTGHKSSTS